MFGNIKGWGISALIVVVVCLLIFVFGTPPQISARTGSIPLAMTSISDVLKEVDPASLGIKSAGNDADAHDLYVKLIDDYKNNHFRYETKYSAKVSQLLVDKPEFLQWMVDASNANQASIFAKKPEQIVNYDNQEDSIVALKQLGILADRLGLDLVGKSKFDEADRYLNAAFILGERLYYERLRFVEFNAGTDLMTGAAYALQKQAVAQHDDVRAKQLDAFQKAVGDYDGKIVSTWKAISGIGGNPLNNAGDIFDVAEKSKEPMWRVEATLKLGRMHYMDNVTPGDQRGAVRVLKRMADDADSYPVRAAAAAGRDLRVEDFRKIGGGS